MSGRVWIGAGALLGMGAVAMAALTAHALDAIGPARLAMVQSAVRMEGWHALALLGTGLWVGQGGGRRAHLAGGAFLAGALLFGTGVYGLALAGWPVAFLAPIGGSLLMLGWALLFVSALLRG
ncbi:MAG: DUF423 domain-containing protein [Rhodospirillales bacterium]|nr:DUF423 domain-containing protein [Rhodospirillales bacterium]